MVTTQLRTLSLYAGAPTPHFSFWDDDETDEPLNTEADAAEIRFAAAAERCSGTLQSLHWSSDEHSLGTDGVSALSSAIRSVVECGTTLELRLIGANTGAKGILAPPLIDAMRTVRGLCVLRIDWIYCGIVDADVVAVADAIATLEHLNDVALQFAHNRTILKAQTPNAFAVLPLQLHSLRLDFRWTAVYATEALIALWVGLSDATHRPKQGLRRARVEFSVPCDGNETPIGILSAVFNDTTATATGCTHPDARLEFWLN